MFPYGFFMMQPHELRSASPETLEWLRQKEQEAKTPEEKAEVDRLYRIYTHLKDDYSDLDTFAEVCKMFYYFSVGLLVFTVVMFIYRVFFGR